MEFNETKLHSMKAWWVLGRDQNWHLNITEYSGGSLIIQPINSTQLLYHTERYKTTGMTQASQVLKRRQDWRGITVQGRCSTNRVLPIHFGWVSAAGVCWPHTPWHARDVHVCACPLVGKFHPQIFLRCDIISVRFGYFKSLAFFQPPSFVSYYNVWRITECGSWLFITTSLLLQFAIMAIYGGNKQSAKKKMKLHSVFSLTNPSFHKKNLIYSLYVIFLKMTFFSSNNRQQRKPGCLVVQNM